MKILQLVTKRQYRGAEVFAANLSKELISLGHDIIFAGLYTNTENVLVVQNAQNLDLIGEKKGNFSLRLIRALVDLINQSRPDIIQCNGSDTLKYAIAASYFTNNTPIVYRNISTISEWLDSGVKLSLYKKIFKKVDHVTSVGSESIEDLITTLEYPREQTSVIRRGIPTIEMDHATNRASLFKELGLKQDSKIVMHVGNFSPEKNHDFLIDVFKQLSENHANLKLVCVGDGVTFKSIEGRVLEEGLQDNIFLLGFRKDVPELLSASDCIVLSSFVEGVPGVILEAAVQKKPAVASNVGGVKEVLSNDNTGFIIDKFDVNLYAEKLVELCTDELLNSKMGLNAHNLVLDQFNPLKNAKKFEKLYADLKTSRSIPVQNTDKPLRILQFIQRKQYRGAEIFCCQLSNKLNEKGHHVKIYSIYDGDAELPFSDGVVSLKRDPNLRYADYKGWKAISDIIKEFKPDLIQANASDTLKYTVLSKKIFGWKIPIVFRNASVISFYIDNSASKELNRFLLKSVNKIVSVSKSSLIDLNKLYPFTSIKSEVLSNGISLEANIATEHSISNDYANIIHVGSLTKEKNHLELLEIFKKFLIHIPNGKLHIVGEGTLQDEIQQEIKKLKLEHSVEMYGERQDPKQLIRDADVLVLPSLIEGLPGVVLEAMSLETPVVAYDVGGVSEVLSKETGFLVKAGKKDDFVNAMVQAVKEDNSYLIKKAKYEVDEKYNMDKLSDSFIRVYYETIAESFVNEN